MGSAPATLVLAPSHCGGARVRLLTSQLLAEGLVPQLRAAVSAFGGAAPSHGVLPAAATISGSTRARLALTPRTLVTRSSRMRSVARSSSVRSAKRVVD